jgi:hypothetical protein
MTKYIATVEWVSEEGTMCDVSFVGNFIVAWGDASKFCVRAELQTAKITLYPAFLDEDLSKISLDTLDRLLVDSSHNADPSDLTDQRHL